MTVRQKNRTSKNSRFNRKRLVKKSPGGLNPRPNRLRPSAARLMSTADKPLLRKLPLLSPNRLWFAAKSPNALPRSPAKMLRLSIAATPKKFIMPMTRLLTFMNSCIICATILLRCSWLMSISACRTPIRTLAKKNSAITGFGFSAAAAKAKTFSLTKGVQWKKTCVSSIFSLTI